MDKWAAMAEEIEERQQLAQDTKDSGRRSIAQLSEIQAADSSVGPKKRRPASPEVVVQSRPRTPSSNGNNSFEQSQSPTKKQKTEQRVLTIDSRLADPGLFTAWCAPASTANTDKVTGVTAAGEQHYEHRARF